MLKDDSRILVTLPSRTEDLPNVGYTGGDNGDYMQHHNPFTYFTDVVNSPSELNNLVPFSQFASDLANMRCPSFPTSFPTSRRVANMANQVAARNSFDRPHSSRSDGRPDPDPSSFPDEATIDPR